MADDTSKTATDGGKTYSPDDVAELALQYRDEMLKELGVIGVSNSSQPYTPGKQIRRVPVETSGCHGHIGTSEFGRILTDVTTYEADDESVPAHENVHYMTIRETTGHAAIYSSATVALGWELPPTPREIHLAEYLEALDKGDVRPDYTPNAGDVSDAIIREVLPTSEDNHTPAIWLELDETPVDNVVALRDCVSALRYDSNDKMNHIVRYEEYDSYGTNCTVDYRLSTDQMIVESHFDNPNGEYGSESWEHIYVNTLSDGWQERDDANSEATGIISYDDDGTNRQTRVVTVPELRKPETVLDIPSVEPEIPN